MFELRRTSAIGFALSLGFACGSESGTDGEGPPPFGGQLPGAPAQMSPDPNVSPEPPAAAPGAPTTSEATPTPETPANVEGTPELPLAQPADPGGGAGGGGGTAQQGTAGAGTAGTGAGTAGASAEPNPPDAPATQVFLLFGQSNMWGVPNPQAQDLVINPRVEVLTMTSCGRHGTNQWVPAQPPLHGCVGQAGTGANGPGVGPGDYFAKTLADAFPDDTILLVPNAIPGVSIDVFQPGQAAYNSTLSRARMAQQRGEIRGIIFHQGETDSGQDSWPGRVKTVVDRLRSDLGIGEVPFVAGELFRGCPCAGHNTFVNQLPSTISNTFVVPSDGGFAAIPNDGFGNLHFDLAAQRTFGRRYGQVMLDALGL